jgi:hypothetical protein
MNRITITPEARNLIETFRNANINVYSALSEFVDNSFDAGAKRIDFRVTLKDNKYAVDITDNGSGMTKENLAAALSLGSLSEKKLTGTGKFGSGMKIAAMNLFDEISIITRPVNEINYFKAHINFQEIVATNKFVGYVSEIPNTDNNGSTGTAIYLSGDRGKISIFNTNFLKRLSAYLGRVFRKFLLNGHDIYVNDKKVEPVSPLYIDKAAIFSDYSTILHVVDVNDNILCEGSVNIKFSVLKTDFNPDIKTGGLFIIRNGREVFSGGIPKTQDNQKLFKIDEKLLGRVRIELNIDNTFDQYLMVDFNKQNVVLDYYMLRSLQKVLSPLVERAINYVSSTSRLEVVVDKVQLQKHKKQSAAKDKNNWLKEMINYPQRKVQNLNDETILATVSIDANNNLYVAVNGNHHLIHKEI